jgi:TonB family protein
MKRLCLILTILWAATSAAEAQESKKLVYEGRVVNTKGIPIKDVFVGTIKSGTSANTGVDGIFRLELPAEGDSVVVSKRGLTDYRAYLLPGFDIVFILGEGGSSWLPYVEYRDKMKETSQVYLDQGLKFLSEEGGQDYNKAFACFFRSACMENAQAAYQLGRMYEEGLWATQDYPKAIDWYKKAKNVAKASTRLGILYEEGKGVEQDYKKAISYYLEATGLGDKEEAAKRAENMYAQNLVEREVEGDRLFDIPEEAAQFPGDVYAWLSRNIRYPAKCQEYGIQGRVMVQFIINKDGSVTDVKVLRAPDPALAAEGKRVVSTMPKWKPATQGGKLVLSRFVLPVMFRLT